MTHLVDLPPELLDIILQKSQENTMRHEDTARDGKLGQSDLMSLCLACHAIRRIAQQHLYVSFISVKRSWRIRAFLRTIATRSDLAEHVQYVSLEGWSLLSPWSSSLEDH